LPPFVMKGGERKKCYNFLSPHLGLVFAALSLSDARGRGAFSGDLSLLSLDLFVDLFPVDGHISWRADFSATYQSAWLILMFHSITQETYLSRI